MTIQALPIHDAADVWNDAYAVNDSFTPFLTHAWHMHWYTHFGKEWEPLILRVSDTIIAPFVRKDDTVAFSGGKEIADYLDIIGPDDKKPAAWDAILPHLKEHGIAHAVFHNIPNSSATHTYFETQTTHQTQEWHVRVEQEDTTPILRLPDTWDTYTQTLPRKYRHELKRKLRKFDREHPGTEISKQSGTQIDIETLLTLMKHNPDKQTFLTTRMEHFFREIPQVIPRETHMYVLRDATHAIGAVLTFKDDTCVQLYNSGYMPDCPGAGFYLKAKLIDQAIRDGKKTLNFLQGSERYKYELGGEDFLVFTAHITM